MYCSTTCKMMVESEVRYGWQGHVRSCKVRKARRSRDVGKCDDGQTCSASSTFYDSGKCIKTGKPLPLMSQHVCSFVL